MLELDDLSKDFPALPFTVKVSARLSAGSITFITGASGAGKSTLLAVIAGHIPPDRGQLLDGDLPLHLRPLGQRRCCLQLQSGSLFEQLTTLDNVALGLDNKLNPETRQQAAAMLAQVQLSHRLYSRVSTLSAGEKARANLAQTLLRARSARLVLLDEPVAAIATPQRPALWQLIFSCLQPPVAYLLISTHLLPDPALLPSQASVSFLHMENGHGQQTSYPPEGFG